MPRISAEREEATRQRILDAAGRVFAERGFHEASIDDVVRASGLSVGAIYTYFRGKDDLIRASCLAAISDTIDAVLADLRTAGTVREKLERAVDAWITGLAEDPGLPPFLVQSWSSAGSVPAIRDMLLRRRERIVTVGTMLLREGVQAGEFRTDLDVDRLARGFTALLDGMLLEQLERPRDGGADAGAREEERARARAFLDLLAPSPSGV